MAIKKNRAIQNKDRDERIENMGMDELKRYLCFKNNQDPTKCEGCPGSKTCKAGQRAIVLLNEMERAKMNAEIENKKGKTLSEIQENARRCFLDAAAQPEMIQYVMETYGNTRNAAREKLKNWARSHPDIAEQTGFWEKFGALTKRSPKNFQDNVYGRTSEAIRKYIEAAKQENPVQFVMDKYGMDRKNASHTYYQWRSRYKNRIEVQEEKPVEEAPAEPESDEISVEDFLKNYTMQDVVEENPVPTLTVNSDINVVEEIVTGNGFNAELNAKYTKLEKERVELLKRISWLEKAMDALKVTMDLFSEEGENA